MGKDLRRPPLGLSTNFVSNFLTFVLQHKKPKFFQKTHISNDTNLAFVPSVPTNPPKNYLMALPVNT